MMILRLIFRRRRQRFTFTLGRHFFARYARLQIQQLQLQIAQRLAALAVTRDTIPPKTLFQRTDLQPRIIQFARLRFELLLFGFQLLL